MAVCWINSNRWKSSKVIKNANISRQVWASIFWDAHGILFIERKNHQYQILYSIIGGFEGRNHSNRPQMKKKSALSPRQCTISPVDRNDSKTTWVALRIASSPSLFSRSSPQRLLAVCKPQNNAPWENTWLQWRTDIRTWRVFWGQKQIVQQKLHRIIKEALESLHDPWRRLCWWIKSISA